MPYTFFTVETVLKKYCRSSKLALGFGPTHEHTLDSLWVKCCTVMASPANLVCPYAFESKWRHNDAGPQTWTAVNNEFSDCLLCAIDVLRVSFALYTFFSFVVSYFPGRHIRPGQLRDWLTNHSGAFGAGGFGAAVRWKIIFPGTLLCLFSACRACYCTPGRQNWFYAFLYCRRTCVSAMQALAAVEGVLGMRCFLSSIWTPAKKEVPYFVMSCCLVDMWQSGIRKLISNGRTAF